VEILRFKQFSRLFLKIEHYHPRFEDDKDIVSVHGEKCPKNLK
jgi:hypothetical protein